MGVVLTAKERAMYEARLAAIVMAMRHGEVAYRVHALDRMKERGITPSIIEQALDQSAPEVIEDYPNDPRGASCLILSWFQSCALHVQVVTP